MSLFTFKGESLECLYDPQEADGDHAHGLSEADGDDDVDWQIEATAKHENGSDESIGHRAQ